ncbi:nitrogen regulatory protein [Oceaniovalibus guishaninsula JLT2003]|uniref:Nitrogen regulatory protein n=2 Tax=Oceaniovalibus TaxID=1207070 RepID=K2H9N2_9RHOB|nr:nitrogen regulatory protein [Oceaniovalibus guishaninsula JLT2003]
MTSKKRLFHALGEVASTVYGMDCDRVIEGLLERESLGPTGVGQGVALPHARLDGLTRVHGVFLRLERPVEYGAVDRQPVDLVFGLFAPLDAGVEHLKSLAVVSRTLRDPELCAMLRANDDPATLHTMLIAGRRTIPV